MKPSAHLPFLLLLAVLALGACGKQSEPATDAGGAPASDPKAATTASTATSVEKLENQATASADETNPTAEDGAQGESATGDSEPDDAESPRVPAAGAAAGGAATGTPYTAASAAKLVAKKGYLADTSTWDASRELNVLTGVLKGSADGYNSRAFFFVGDRYLGTDTARASASVTFSSRTADTIRLQYIVYEDADAMCCPTPPPVTVGFRWNGHTLAPTGAIPPVSRRR